MPEAKPHAKWAVPLFTTVALILVAAIVYDFVRGEAIKGWQAGALAISAYLAVISWRKRRKEVGTP